MTAVAAVSDGSGGCGGGDSGDSSVGGGGDSDENGGGGGVTAVTAMEAEGSRGQGDGSGIDSECDSADSGDKVTAEVVAVKLEAVDRGPVVDSLRVRRSSEGGIPDSLSIVGGMLSSHLSSAWRRGEPGRAAVMALSVAGTRFGHFSLSSCLLPRPVVPRALWTHYF